MKKMLLFVAVVVAVLVVDNIQAQVNVNFDINIRKQPVWGPTGYDHVEYYYMPDIECYYYVSKRKFIYFDNGEWRFASQLPYRYGNYDLEHAYKIVVNDYRPYLNHPYYRDKYTRVIVEHHEPQPLIRESNDPRYYQIKEHPHHGEWKNYKDKYEHEHEHGRR